MREPGGGVRVEALPGCFGPGGRVLRLGEDAGEEVVGFW